MNRHEYYFPNMVVEQMNIPFTVKFATKDPDDLVMKQLEMTTKKIEKKLKQVDLDFSPFKPDSLVSKYQLGDRQPLLNSKDFQSIYAQSILAEQMTDGVFTPYFSDKYDPTGLVKGWAIEQSFEQYLRPLLADPKIEGVSLNGGGDMKVATRDDSNFQWGIGIENPESLLDVIATYYLRNGAVATSGNSKRGEHIVKKSVNKVTQVTIVSNSLVDADVWATTGVAAENDQFLHMIKEHELSGLLIRHKNAPLNFSEGAIVNVKETPL